MARAMLRDDFGSYYTGSCIGTRLDDDSGSSVQIGIGDGTGSGPDGGAFVPPANLYPLLTIRERFAAGYDDDGNPTWTWADVVDGVGMIAYETREEKDDRAGITLVKADMVFLHPFSAPAIRETATVRTSDGHRWSIDGLKRFPDRLQLEVTRIDDGE